MKIKTNKPTSIRLTPVAKQLLEDSAQRLGISRSAVMELAIRKFAIKEGVK